MDLDALDLDLSAAERERFQAIFPHCVNAALLRAGESIEDAVLTTLGVIRIERDVLTKAKAIHDEAKANA